MYTEMRAGQPVNCEEYTMPKYDLATADQFVALQLILDWGRPGPLAKQSPILKRDVVGLGVCCKPHRMCMNVIQVLYVKTALVAEVIVN